jgi:putative ABC transport system substrate-binding protein
MRRREFITLLGGAAAAWPLAARAQQPAMPVVGFLGSDSFEQYAERLRALREGLKDTGFTEGQNVVVEYRWAEGHNDRLPALAADLVRRRVAVLVASTTPSVLALKAATTEIPVVFFVAGDPVALGLVSSLNRPGGNLTGTTSMTLEVGSKWLQLLHEIVPAATDFAVLINPTSPDLATAQSNDLQTAARALGLQLRVLEASTERDFDTVFAKFGQLKVGGLVISSDSFFFARIGRLATLATHHRIPAIFGFPDFAKAGGLMSYGASVTAQHRTIGAYAGRILKGEKPAELPVQQSTKFELVVNLKAAKALGIIFSPTMVARADEVIE